MRKEAQQILQQLNEGKSISQIEGNAKTKSRIHRIFLYRKAINQLLDDMIEGEYRLSVYELQKIIKK